MPIKFTSTLDVTNNRITNVGAPTAGNDAVTKTYVDSVATGLVWKDAVRAASVTDIDLTSPGAIDGVTLASADRVLLMGQNDPAENGIYTFSGGTLARSADADSAAELRPGSIATVSEGAGQGNKTYVLITDGPVTLGTTPLTWTLANNNTAAVYVGGNGVAVDPSTHAIAVTPAPNGGLASGGSGVSVVAGDGIVVDSNGVGVVGTGAITVDGSGVGIDTGDGLAIAGGELTVTAGDGIVIDTNGVSVGSNAAGAIAVDGTGVSVVAGDGIIVDTNGVSVDAGDGLQITSGHVTAKAATGIVVSASGVGIDTTIVPQVFSGTVGNGTDAVLQVTHNLNTLRVGVEVYTNSAPYETVLVGVSRPNANTIELDFGTAPTSNEYAVVVWGCKP